MKIPRLIVLGITAAATMLVFGCGGTAGVATEKQPAADHRAALMGVWKGSVDLGGIRVRAAISLNASRFVTVYELGLTDRYFTDVDSGAWDATDAELMTTWIDGRAKATNTVPYTLDGDSLTVQALVPFDPSWPIAELPQEMTLARVADWGAGDFVGRWEASWGFDDGRSRLLALTYNADGTCSWYELSEYAEEENRGDRLLSLDGTCELDLDEHFLLMNVTDEETAGRYNDPPFEGHTLRFAFARGLGSDIWVSIFWNEMQYVPLDGEWRDSTDNPYGGYWTWLYKQ